MELDEEIVYGTHDDSHIVMSEKVQSLAGSIYQEFEKMITKYDEEVVKDLMPLVVNVLESLDLAFTENQEHEVELELLREDNEQLVTQYEREKQLRKAADQKLFQIEDALEDDKKELNSKIESLESIVRMLELKSKNASDHVYRLEEKEAELKKEYSILHERYTELLKTHMEYIERTKLMMGSSTSDRMDSRPPRLPSMGIGHMNSRSSGPVSFGFQSLENATNANNLKCITSPGAEYPPIAASPDSTHSNISLRNELGPNEDISLRDPTDEDHSYREQSERGWSETLGSVSKDVSPDQDISEDMPPPPIPSTPAGKSTTKREQRSGNTLYQELSFQDNDTMGDLEDGPEVTGMGKEIENLIMENNELLATKNALNIVKDDLIIKVDELTSELEIVRDEMKSLTSFKAKLKDRLTELEEELRRTREEADRNVKANKSDDEEDIPMAQRKRFTRVEMARVLMERNQYKERFMELQEAVRWTEMVRATRHETEFDKKNRLSVWKFFGNLFSGSGDGRGGSSGMGVGRKNLPYGDVRYNAPSHHVSPALDTIRKRNFQERKRGLDHIESGDLCSEKIATRRANERREQYRQVRAHVRKDDGRLQAYGWSLPAKLTSTPPVHVPPPSSSSGQVPVPVPVYCRPLTEKEPGMKIWCAAGVNLSGGRTSDGGAIVGASVFYSDPRTGSPSLLEGTVANHNSSNKTDEEEEESNKSPEIRKIDEELKEGERLRKEQEDQQQQLSSLVWICTSTQQISKVAVIDANNPADILESFTVCQSHLLCIASVPGAKESDYSVNNSTDDGGLPPTDGSAPPSLDPNLPTSNGHLSSSSERNDGIIDTTTTMTATSNGNCGADTASEQEDNGGEMVNIGHVTFVRVSSSDQPAPDLAPQQSAVEDKSNKCRLPFNTRFLMGPRVVVVGSGSALVTDISDLTSSATESPPPRRLMKEIQEGLVKDGLARPNELDDGNEASEELSKMTSVLPTMWLGSQNGSVFVHSAVSQWRRCLHSIQLKDSVLNIVHVQGRVVCALADGSIAIFRRGPDGQWDLSQYHTVALGLPHHSVRSLAAVYNKVWCGYKNRIHVVDPKTMVVLKSFDAHPRKESQVRQMTWAGDGVWVSIRLDSTLRMYNAHTYQHLQDVDIEPYVSKMLAVLPGGTGKLGFSFVRITALLISSSRLWIGTGNGVIISVPLSESNAGPSATGKGSGAGAASSGVRVFSEPTTAVVSPGSFIPYCSMAQAQLSFHGHRDAVKFFVSVPGSGGLSAATSVPQECPIIENVSGTDKPPSMLVMSGGEGYIDFRIVDDAEEAQDAATHLIVWQLMPPPLGNKCEASVVR
uniref:JNK-interacting protein 3 n=1 Tax=Cacopsylla melanoneura TaxID=428564 RepID=A0A8D8Y727_9HEMI